MTKEEARRRAVTAGGENEYVAYRDCTKFTFREDLEPMPEWWVDENLFPENRGKMTRIKCPGLSCRQKTKPSQGNRACSNGTLCYECCDLYQQSGFPACEHSSHNVKRNIHQVRGPNNHQLAPHNNSPTGCSSIVRDSEARSTFWRSLSAW